MEGSLHRIEENLQRKVLKEEGGKEDSMIGQAHSLNIVITAMA